MGMAQAMLGDKKSALAEYAVLKDLHPELAESLFKTIYP
jgi:hypothetical protein